MPDIHQHNLGFRERIHPHSHALHSCHSALVFYTLSRFFPLSFMFCLPYDLIRVEPIWICASIFFSPYFSGFRFCVRKSRFPLIYQPLWFFQIGRPNPAKMFMSFFFIIFWADKFTIHNIHSHTYTTDHRYILRENRTRLDRKRREREGERENQWLR